MSKKINKQEYREGRVKVSDKIRGTIAKLIIKEKDFERKKKHTAKWYQEEVAKELKLEDKDNPSLRSYESIIQPIKKSLQVKNLPDNFWTIGSCIKYDIPADMIPVLIKEQQLRMNSNLGPGNLTIREAIWFARLYPALNQIAQRLFPNADPMIWHGMVSIASRQYSHKEQISELMDKEYADTRDLDNTFLVKEDFSIWSSLRDWAQTMLKEERDLRYAEEEREPTKIDGFVTYSQVVSDKKDKSPKRQKPLEGNYRNGGQGK